MFVPDSNFHTPTRKAETAFFGGYIQKLFTRDPLNQLVKVICSVAEMYLRDPVKGGRLPGSGPTNEARSERLANPRQRGEDSAPFRGPFKDF